MRKNLSPSSTKRDTKNNSPVTLKNFFRGTVKDPPAGNVRDCLADSYNLTIHKDYYEGRTGCEPYTQTEFPAILTGLSAHKSGKNIISDDGSIFTVEHIGCFFGFGGTFEMITEYVSSGEVVGSDTVYRETLAGKIIGPLNVWVFHKTAKLWHLLIGRELYYASIAIPSWESVLVISRDRPSNSDSDHSEHKDTLLVYNTNGLFKVLSGASYPIAYKMNINPPEQRIVSTEYDEDIHSHRYRYLYGGMRLEANGIIVDRQTLDVIGLETGTNVAGDNDIDYAEIGTVSEVSETNPVIVTELWVPTVLNSNPVEYQWHLTHFSIYRTPDLESVNPLDPDRIQYNDPSQFIWAKDLRTCGAFYGSITDGIFTAVIGELEIADTYNVLELDDGQRFEITEVLTSKTGRVSGGYYGVDVPLCAAAIGNGRVFRGSITGGILTRTHGDTFSVSDERKTLYNSSGYKIYITDYIDENNVRVHINTSMPVQGFTMDPTHRIFYDTIEDSVLTARKDFYTCNTRYKTPLPNCNIGVTIPGFILCALRGAKEFFYSALQDNYDYLIGQHVKIQRSEIVQDSISFFWRFQDIVSIVCNNSTWGSQIGLSEFTTLPGSNETVPILTGVKQTSKNIGCVDYGSVTEVDGDMIFLITNEQGVEAGRIFNGVSYSENDYLTDSQLGGRILKALRKTKRLSQAIFDGILGLVIWRKNT